ncbi:copper amine oxidase N-terminal domain-containing protein [Cohnella boryungensis]|uniref:Stalk domain-containing protein n=1 Tax=Cohnella boryungensis TaxID=768479 RepID=A0ABV8SEQ8_9BACL
MVLKRATMVSALALVLGASSASAGVAAAATKASAAQATNAAYIVNSVPVNLSTLYEKGKTLVSLRDLSPKLGVRLEVLGGSIHAKLNGHVVVLKSGSNVIHVDGAEQKLQVPVKSVKGITYVELKAFVEALGAQFAKDESGAIWIDAYLLANVESIQWVDAGRFIASQEKESGRADFLVDALTGKSQQLLISEDASELAVAPNGKKAAYTNAKGEVFVLDFTAPRPVQVSVDTSIKPELVWSADSSVLYFLQGEKGSVIAQLEPEIGKITKIVDDKVDYKANLQVSADGKVFTYTVTKPGTVVADGSKPVEADDVSIDMKGTEPQIYQFTVNPEVKDNKAVQLTTSADDKVFIHASPEAASVAYVSIDADEAAKSKLVSVGKDNKVVPLYNEKDVYQAVWTGGKWYLLTEGDGASQFVYEVDPTSGAAKQLYTVSDSVTDIVVKQGAPMALIQDGRVFLDINGHWKPTTRK